MNESKPETLSPDRVAEICRIKGETEKHLWDRIMDNRHELRTAGNAPDKALDKAVEMVASEVGLLPHEGYAFYHHLRGLKLDDNPEPQGD